MPRYAPLPLISIDPRNEAQLVQDASQRVYEASNATLNDFSSGNPLAALLEGQAFAQGEFLFWANQLPEKILIEWIGPFLGAMRRLGTPAATLVKVTVPPQNTDIIIPAGSSFFTDAQLTSGQSFQFVSSSDYTIAAGKTEVSIPVYSKFVGSVYNSPANSITIPPTLGITGIEVTNPDPAVGGSDVESDDEVKERFFTLIRRRNPVSKSDWENFFIDLYGVGTLTSVQPNRSGPQSYSYLTDYERPNGQVSFFVLGPDGTELTEDQIRRGQNVINFSVPIENRGYLYPISLSQAQYNLTVEVDANGTYGPDFQSSSLNFRNRAYDILLPGNVFPADVNPTVSDIDAAFYNTFEADTRFRDPKVISSSVYNTPSLLSADAATYTKVRKFEPSGQLLNTGDLVSIKGANTVYYPVEEGFTPYSTDKFDQTIYGNLALKQIKELGAGLFTAGDVVTKSGKLFVVCENIEISFESDLARAFETGKISGEKEYSDWVEGNSYSYSVESTVDPEIVEYDYSEDEFKPSTLAGRLVWLVAKNFQLEPSTNNITGASAEFKLGAALNSGEENLKELKEGETYLEGTWVFTPSIGGGPDFEVDPYYHYVDTYLGAVKKFAKVANTFEYSPNGMKTFDYFNLLESNGSIKTVPVYDGTEGLPIYKYKPRFKCGQYLEFRETSGSLPTYLIAANYFTPFSSSLEDLLASGVVINLAPTSTLYDQLTNLLLAGTKGRINEVETLNSGTNLTNGTYFNVPLTYADSDVGNGRGASVNVTVENNSAVFVELSSFGQYYEPLDILKVNNSSLGGSGSELSLRVTSTYPFQQTLKSFERMFTFFKGDRTFFRDGNKLKAFTATSSVSPLFDFSVYYKNGIFVESNLEEVSISDQTSYVPFYDSSYTLFAEDTVTDEDGKNFYRVMRPFTPSEEVTNWTQLVVSNTPRNEEYAGNLLRFVNLYKCDEEVLSQSDLQTSAIKLGVAQITIVPKNTGRLFGLNQKLTYVWENSDSPASAELSWSPGTNYPYLPVDYKEGTLRL